jgi:bromodomain-containing factor 1
MDEDLEAEKIRKLEDRMKLFEKTTNGDAVTPEPHAAHAHDSEHSSESSSDDDSSGSESE